MSSLRTKTRLLTSYFWQTPTALTRSCCVAARRRRPSFAWQTLRIWCLRPSACTLVPSRCARRVAGPDTAAAKADRYKNWKQSLSKKIRHEHTPEKKTFRVGTYTTRPNTKHQQPQHRSPKPTSASPPASSPFKNDIDASYNCCTSVQASPGAAQHSSKL